LTGHADEAVELAKRAVAIGLEIEHPLSQCMGYMWAMHAAFSAREYALAREWAEALLQVCERHGFPQWSAGGMVVSGACRVLAGETEFGLKLVGEGLRAQRIGVQTWLGTLLIISATAHMHAGNPARALEMLTEAVAHMQTTGATVGLPEAERLQAEVLLLSRQIATTEAISRIKGAEKLAQKQGALALEWRATMSLASLLSHAGHTIEARDILRQNYVRFTEGFASLDLLEGKRLLDAMN
jgi:predicted ATPase